MSAIEVIVWVAGVYMALGLIFSIIFVILGVSKVDPAAKGTGFGFKLIIIPGLLVFWPLFMMRWLKGVTEPPIEKTAHKQLAQD